LLLHRLITLRATGPHRGRQRLICPQAGCNAVTLLALLPPLGLLLLVLQLLLQPRN
jgi:hypothetical protein